MTNEVLYDRQRPLNLDIPHSAIIVGVGGIGTHVAIDLALSGCPELHLFDGDRLELSNFNRLPLDSRVNMGRLKTEAVSDYIRAIRPDCHVETYGVANDFMLATISVDILFDCTDIAETQKHLHQWASKHSVRYIRAGYDGTHFTVMSRPAYWSTGEATRGYQVAPSWIVPATIAGAVAVFKALYAPALEVSMDLQDIGKGGNVSERR